MTRRTGVWLWRWRRNPLKRRSDVVEAWVVIAAWMLGLAGALLAGLATAGAMEQSFARQRVETRAVSAVLTEAAPSATSREATDRNRVWVSVRWTDSRGPHTGRTEMSPSTPAGTRVTVWTDRQDHLTSKPSSWADAALQSSLGGVWAAAAAGGVVVGGARVARARLDRQRMAQWAEEWERVDTRWGRKTG